MLLVAEFDRRLGWVPSGHRSCAHWLAWEVGLDVHTAYEKVRVAHALVEFPEFATAMSTGALAYAKARAITRIASADNADELLKMALSSTANQVEKVVAACRRAEPSAEAAAARAFRERAMTWRLDGATAVITLRLPVDLASEFYGAVEGFVDCSDLDLPEVARLADAVSVMADVATVALRNGVEPTTDPRYLASVHLTPEVFDDEPDDAEGSSALGGGVCCVGPGEGLRIHPASVARSTARRLLCDAVLQGFRTNASGEAEVGTTSRTVSRKLKRALQRRDGGCLFPGCTMPAVWADAHHIQHWLDHGPTRPYNLVCLCRRHHRLMHEGGWNITGDPAGDLFFHKPDGTILAGQPPRCLGDAALVNAFGRSAQDGRCGWTTKRFNFAAVAEMIIDTERARGRARDCRPTRETELASNLSP